MEYDLNEAKVLVIGDVMLDRSWSGNAKRISPEAPVPVVHVQDITEQAGGAGNVALNISALNGQVMLCSMIGKDEAGAKLTHLLKAKNVETLFAKSIRPTITKLRVLSQHQQLLRMDFEECLFNLPKKDLFTQYLDNIKRCSAVVISDYGKGTLSQVQELIKHARSLKTPVLVDPKGTDFKKYIGATIITPNMKEFEAVVGTCQSEEDIITKAKQLIEDINLDALLITRSEKGMTLVHKNGDFVSIPTKAKEVFDVTGAGDTVIAVMAMALSIQCSYKDAMHLANAAASIVVGKVGTATISLDELHMALGKINQIDTGIISEQQVSQAMKIAHLQGEKVVMTNGCFDILHAGHVEYLTKARSLGDRLIVAVNDDASVRRLKGNERPIIGLSERMALLAALECVDWVVPFKADTPERIISSLLPDILVKGEDYQVHEIAGAKQVLENGGEVKTITLKPNCSSSFIIEKIKGIK